MTMHGPQCANEHTEYSEHCDACRADHAALMEVLEAQAEQAQAMTDRLSDAGVTVPGAVFAGARVEALVETLLDTRRARMAYEYVVGEKVITQLEDAQRLLDETAEASGLVVPTKKPGASLHLP